MSNYKSGKPIFFVSMVILIGFLLSPLLILSGYLISEEIKKNEVHKRVNVEYFQQSILRSEKIVVMYKKIEYVNPGNGFREYYSDSHKTAVDETSIPDAEYKYLHIYVCDGEYTCSASYYSTQNKFKLSCAKADYETYRKLEFEGHSLGPVLDPKEDAEFPYNSSAHIDNLISYLMI